MTSSSIILKLDDASKDAQKVVVVPTDKIVSTTPSDKKTLEEAKQPLLNEEAEPELTCGKKLAYYLQGLSFIGLLFGPKASTKEGRHAQGAGFATSCAAGGLYLITKAL